MSTQFKVFLGVFLGILGAAIIVGFVYYGIQGVLHAWEDHKLVDLIRIDIRNAQQVRTPQPSPSPEGDKKSDEKVIKK